jgi:hypothetical protein
MDSTQKNPTNAMEWEKEWEMDMDDEELIRIYDQVIGVESLPQAKSDGGDGETMNRGRDEATFEALLEEVLNM